MNCPSCSDGHLTGFGGLSLPNLPGSPLHAFPYNLDLHCDSLLFPLPQLYTCILFTVEIIWLLKLMGENCALPLSSLLLDAGLLPIPFFCPLFHFIVPHPIFVAIPYRAFCSPSHLKKIVHYPSFLFPILFFLSSALPSLLWILPSLPAPFPVHKGFIWPQI